LHGDATGLEFAEGFGDIVRIKNSEEGFSFIYGGLGSGDVECVCAGVGDDAERLGVGLESGESGHGGDGLSDGAEHAAEAEAAVRGGAGHAAGGKELFKECSRFGGVGDFEVEDCPADAEGDGFLEEVHHFFKSVEGVFVVGEEEEVITVNDDTDIRFSSLRGLGGGDNWESGIVWGIQSDGVVEDFLAESGLGMGLRLSGGGLSFAGRS
jgi:hypothetical protein